MKFWPSDSFVIETSLSLAEILAALESKVEPKRLFRRSTDHAPFQGEISRDGFQITRIIHYRNSFLPTVTGRFQPGEAGVEVTIRLSPHPFVTAFLTIWMGGVGVALLFALAGTLDGEMPSSLLLLGPLGMLLFAWALVSAGFWLEARKQKPMLIEILRRAETAE